MISVFAGRIADAGVDPVPIMADAKALLADHPNLELLWASPREVLNVVQADQVGCDIITLTPELLDRALVARPGSGDRFPPGGDDVPPGRGVGGLLALGARPSIACAQSPR